MLGDCVGLRESVLPFFNIQHATTRIILSGCMFDGATVRDKIARVGMGTKRASQSSIDGDGVAPALPTPSSPRLRRRRGS